MKPRTRESSSSTRARRLLLTCRWIGRGRGRGWAPRGWWSRRSWRSPGTGPCWTPASCPRSNLTKQTKPKPKINTRTSKIISRNFSHRSMAPPPLPLPSFSVSRPTRTDAPRFATPWMKRSKKNVAGVKQRRSRSRVVILPSLKRYHNIIIRDNFIIYFFSG